MYPTALEETIQYVFKDRELLYEAITHSSCFNGKKEEKKSKNEKLEYLGDAILNSVISILLYKRYKDRTEGFLSNARSCLVKRETLTAVARAINLDVHMAYGGRNESVPEESKVLSNMLESLIGAIYLDGGIRKATKVVRSLFKGRFDEEKLEEKSPKNLLQEYSQKKLAILPKYRVTKKGKTGFTVLVVVGKEFKARGAGKSKKEAEQQAARELLALFTQDGERKKKQHGALSEAARSAGPAPDENDTVGVAAEPPPESIQDEAAPRESATAASVALEDESETDGPWDAGPAGTPLKRRRARQRRMSRGG
jgi:ribonuclease-3